MKIAMDYDETFDRDPEMWRLFVHLAIERGHTVAFVTYRPENGPNSDIEHDADCLGIPIVYTAGMQKAGYYDADIWIDDWPVTIPKAKELGEMWRGCKVNEP